MRTVLLNFSLRYNSMWWPPPHSLAYLCKQTSRGFEEPSWLYRNRQLLLWRPEAYSPDLPVVQYPLWPEGELLSTHEHAHWSPWLHGVEREGEGLPGWASCRLRSGSKHWLLWTSTSNWFNASSCCSNSQHQSLFPMKKRLMATVVIFKLAKKYWVTRDTRIPNAFLLHFKDNMKDNTI